MPYSRLTGYGGSKGVGLEHLVGVEYMVQFMLSTERSFSAFIVLYGADFQLNSSAYFNVLGRNSQNKAVFITHWHYPVMPHEGFLNTLDCT